MRTAAVFCVSLLLAWSAALSGQSAVATRSTNLRRDLSTHHKPIRLLDVGERLTLLSSQKRNGYYHVETTDSTKGWTWARNVQMDTAVAVVRTDAGKTVPAKPVTDSSGNAKAKDETQLLLKKWEFWGGLITVLITTIGGIFVAYLARPSRQGEPSGQRAQAVGAVLPALGVGALGLIVLFALPNRVQTSSSVLSSRDVSTLARAEARLEVGAATSRLDALARSVDSLQLKLTDFAGKVSAMTEAASVTRQRLPTENYLLEGYSDLTHEFRAASRDIESLRAQLAIETDRSRFFAVILLGVFAVAFGLLAFAPRIFVRVPRIDPTLPSRKD